MKYYLALVLKFLLFCDLLLIKNTCVTGPLRFAGPNLATFAMQVRADINNWTIQHILSPPALALVKDFQNILLLYRF